jgi:hypothetical protein
VRVRLVRHHKDRARRRRRRNRHRSLVRSLPSRRNSAGRSAQNGTGGSLAARYTRWVRLRAVSGSTRS